MDPMVVDAVSCMASNMWILGYVVDAQPFNLMKSKSNTWRPLPFQKRILMRIAEGIKEAPRKIKKIRSKLLHGKKPDLIIVDEMTEDDMPPF